MSVSEALYETFVAARRVNEAAYLYFQSEPSGSAWLEDLRHTRVHPRFIQTIGLYLEVGVSAPQAIWTPWGRWHCWGQSRIEDDVNPLDEFLGCLDLEVIGSDFIGARGSYGPHYAIVGVNGTVLPTSSIRTQRGYLGTKLARILWDEMVKMYES